MTVEELLNQKQLSYLPKGNDFVVRCLNPDHADKNPSMRIDRIDGRFNCFACEYKGNIFSHFGESATGLQLTRNKLIAKIQQKRAESVGVEMPHNSSPYVISWRGISPKTYRKFEAFQHNDKDFINRINFPIRDLSGKIIGFQGRHTSDGVPKYKFSPPGVKLPLFPRVSPRHGEVMLVEGLFDMLNLHDKGITNAVCCFGTNNINEDKLSILKMQNVERISVFFDGDEAGQKAAENIKIMCENTDLLYRNIYLKDTDPGELTAAQIKGLEKKLYET